MHFAQKDNVSTVTEAVMYTSWNTIVWQYSWNQRGPHLWNSKDPA